MKNRPVAVEILARLGYCLWVIDDTQSSLKCYETAYSLFERLGNRTQSGEMQRMIGAFIGSSRTVNRPCSITIAALSHIRAGTSNTGIGPRHQFDFTNAYAGS